MCIIFYLERFELELESLFYLVLISVSFYVLYFIATIFRTYCATDSHCLHLDSIPIRAERKFQLFRTLMIFRQLCLFIHIRAIKQTESIEKSMHYWSCYSEKISIVNTIVICPEYITKLARVVNFWLKIQVTNLWQNDKS